MPFLGFEMSTPMLFKLEEIPGYHFSSNIITFLGLSPQIQQAKVY